MSCPWMCLHSLHCVLCLQRMPSLKWTSEERIMRMSVISSIVIVFLFFCWLWWNQLKWEAHWAFWICSGNREAFFWCLIYVQMFEKTKTDAWIVSILWHLTLCSVWDTWPVNFQSFWKLNHQYFIWRDSYCDSKCIIYTVVFIFIFTPRFFFFWPPGGSRNKL